MNALILAMVISNSNMIVGGQGYCVFEFTLRDDVGGYSNVQIELEPQFDPDNTATARTTLDNVIINVARPGRQGKKAGGETDCNVTGFRVVQGSGSYKGQTIDLLDAGELKAGSGDLPVAIGGN